MDKLRVTITVRITEGRYGCEQLAQEEVELLGSPDGLATLSVAGLVCSLYRDTLRQAAGAKEEEKDGRHNQIE